MDNKMLKAALEEMPRVVFQSIVGNARACAPKNKVQRRVEIRSGKRPRACGGEQPPPNS